MFLTSLAVRSVFLCVILLVFVTIGKAGWLQKIIYNEKRAIRAVDSHPSRTLNSSGVGTVFDSSDGNVLEHNDRTGHDMTRHDTILNIEGNPDVENNTPLHQISPDTDKETLYRENALLKQKMEDAEKRLPKEVDVSNHPSIDVSLDDRSEDVPMSTLTDEPSVFIKGAKLITTGDSSASDKTDSKTEPNDKAPIVHIDMPPAHVYKPTIVNHDPSTPPFLHELSTQTKEANVAPNNVLSEEHPDDSAKNENRNAHEEKGNHDESSDDHLKKELEADALNSAFTTSLLSATSMLPPPPEVSTKSQDVGRQPPVRVQAVGSSLQPKGEEDFKPQTQQSDETNQQQQYENDETKAVAKQTLYDLTKSLIKNGNIGGASVYIPQRASASTESNDIGTHVHSSNDKDYNASPYFNNGLERPPVLDNSHIVNEINEELKSVYGQTHNENELNNPIGNIYGQTNNMPITNAAGFNIGQNINGYSVGRKINNDFNVGRKINNDFNVGRNRNNDFNVDQRNQHLQLPYGTNAVGLLPYQLPETSLNNIQTNNYGTGSTAPNSISPQRTSYNIPQRISTSYIMPPQAYYQQSYTESLQNGHEIATLHQLPSASLSNNSTARYNKIRILCIGDSLTSGYYGDRHVYHPFSIQLGELLNSNIADEFELITKGIGGEKVHQMYARLQQLLLGEKPLDLVIILGGLNDLIKLDISVDIFRQVVALHELCHQFGVSTVTMTIPETHMPLSRQVYANYDQFLVVWGSLNEKIRNYSSNWTIPCDLARKFPLASLTAAEKRAWWSKDFIHPTMEGYNQIGRIVYGCIVSIL